MKSAHRFWLAVGLLVVWAVSAFQPAWAQTGGKVVTFAPETTGFPMISFVMEAYGPDNQFLQDLTPANVSVSEDGQTRPVDSLVLLRPGVQTVVAFNVGPTLTFRFEKGSRFAQLIKALTTWAQAQPSDTTDTFSLTSNTGLLAARLSDTRSWAEALQGFKPVLETSLPNMTSLNSALEMATDLNAGKRKTAILYITPLPSPQQLAALPELANRAIQTNMRISVWLVAQPANATTTEGIAMRDLAERTGGQFFLFSGVENLPDPDLAFQGLRYQYRVTYASGIKNSLPHTVQAVIQRGDLKLTSDERTFDLKIMPPNPIFLAPPAVVDRTWVVPSGQASQALELTPNQVDLKMMVEFPDKITRPLKASRLLVDGSVLVENLNPPFDQFRWSLANETASRQVLVQVEVEDSLGLVARSISVPVQVRVAERPLTTLDRIAAVLTPQRLTIGVAVLAAAVVLAVSLTITRRTAARRKNLSRRERQDPLTQPVPIQQDQPRKRPQTARKVPARPSSADRPSRPLAEPNIPAPARLVRLSDADKQPVPGSAIPLARKEITFGSDPHQAICVIDSPSVSPLHARLTQSSSGLYLLADAGSVAGTWVNYAPISAQGIHLEHGDLIHIGRVLYRFELAKPVLPVPKVTDGEDL